MRRRRVSLAVGLVPSLGLRAAAMDEQPTNAGAVDEMSQTRSVQLLIPATMPRSTGYSQLAVAAGGRIVFVAGQVALDTSGNLIGKDNARAQIQQIFENLERAVTAAGGTFHDVIKLNSYLVDLSHLGDFREVRDTYIDLKNPPASTVVQVSALFRPEFLVEVEAVAVVD